MKLFELEGDELVEIELPSILIRKSVFEKACKLKEGTSLGSWISYLIVKEVKEND